jgi:hypothetical protein
MKPRIKYQHKVWCCKAADWRVTRIVGYGYTPGEAYREWVLLGGGRPPHG